MTNFIKSISVWNCIAFPKISSKIWKKNQSQTIWFHLDCPFRKNWPVFMKIHVSICTFYFDKILSKFRSSAWNIIWAKLSFQGFSITFLENLFYFSFVFFLIYLIHFIQGQYSMTHILFHKKFLIQCWYGLRHNALLEWI